MIKDKLKKRLMKLSMSSINEAWDILKIRRDSLIREKVNNFSVGDRVYFKSKKRGKVLGKVSSVKIKNIGVLADDGVRWIVGAGLLKVEK